MGQRCWGAAPLWRLAGNPAFEQSQQFIFERLAAAGLSPRFESFADSGMGWEQPTGTLRSGGPNGEVLLSRETHRVALAINSFSTPPGGASFPLVDVGAGTTAAAYDGKDVKGAVVLAGSPERTITFLSWRRRRCTWRRRARMRSGR